MFLLVQEDFIVSNSCTEQAILQLQIARNLWQQYELFSKQGRFSVS